MSLKVSIVIPVHNEEKNLRPLTAEIISAMTINDYTYEILFIDDGSRDRSGSILEEIAQEIPQVKVIQFNRNFGQTTAILAGIDFANGEYIVPMDSDLQNDPTDIAKLIEKLEQEHVDIVSGWRKNRRDGFFRTLCSKVANSILSYFLDVRLHDFGCTLKVYRSEVLKQVRLYGDMHRFLPAVAKWQGAKVREMVVNHRPRIHGHSNYNYTRIRAVILDLLAMKFFSSYLKKPIRVFGRLGLWAFTISFIALIKLFYDKFFGSVGISTNPFLLISFISFLLAVQLISIGLLSEVLIRTYFESQGKKTYSVKNTFNLNPKKKHWTTVSEVIHRKMISLNKRPVKPI